MKEWEIQAYVSTQLKRKSILHHGDQNAGKRGPRAAAQAKATGMLAGWPDMVIIPKPYLVLFIEFKLSGGRQSPAQKAVQNQLNQLGFNYHLIKTDDPLEAWQMIEKLL